MQAQINTLSCQFWVSSNAHLWDWCWSQENIQMSEHWEEGDNTSEGACFRSVFGLICTNNSRVNIVHFTTFVSVWKCEKSSAPVSSVTDFPQEGFKIHLESQIHFCHMCKATYFIAGGDTKEWVRKFLISLFPFGIGKQTFSFFFLWFNPVNNIKSM